MKGKNTMIDLNIAQKEQVSELYKFYKKTGVDKPHYFILVKIPVVSQHIVCVNNFLKPDCLPFFDEFHDFANIENFESN